MIIIILTLLLGFLLFIALLRFRNIDEEENAERGIEGSSEYKQQMPHTERTDRNDSAGIEKYDNQCKLNKKSSIIGKISIEQKLSDQVKQENEDQRSVNGKVLDVTMTDDDKNGPSNQDNTGNENLNDKELDGSLLAHEQIFITENVNKQRERIQMSKDAESECRAMEENEDKIYGNTKAMDVNRSDDDENGPSNQNNTGNENLSDKELDGSLLAHEQTFITENVNKQRERIQMSKDAELECRAMEENEGKRNGNTRATDVNRSDDDENEPSNQDNTGNENLGDKELDGSLLAHEQKFITENVNKQRERIQMSKDAEPECRAMEENEGKRNGNTRAMDVNRSDDDENEPSNQDNTGNENLGDNELDGSLLAHEQTFITENVNKQRESIQMSKDAEPECRAMEESENKRYCNTKAMDVNRSDDDENGPSNQDNIGNKNLSDKNLDGSFTEAVNKQKESISTDKDGVPECRTTEDKLLKVLKILNLAGKYPGGLTRDDMYQITNSSLFNELPKCHEELASYFIHKITRYNYKAREFSISRSENKQEPTSSTDPKSSCTQKWKNKRAEEKRGLDVSPMDIIIAVFLCCDDICRQDLVSHMWSCRLAIPLVIQEKAPTLLPSCFLWPLRNLVMKWETQHGGKITVREGRLVKECITSIAFIRIGEIGLSKSALINSVISVSENTHSIFFHRDSLGSTKHKYLTDGLIEISWYFPLPKTEGTTDNHFKDAVMFLNLHGDAYQLQSYLPVLSKLANIVTVLCMVEHLDRCRQVIQPYLNMGNTVLLILTDQKIGIDDEEIRTFWENISDTENQLEYLEVAELQRAYLVQEIRSLLIKLAEGKYVCLDKVCSSDIDVTVDEKSDTFLNTKKEALVISTLLRKTPYKERKSLFLYLQGEPWIKWAEADKEKLRITNKKKGEDAEMYMVERGKTMNKCRLQQREFLKKGNTQSLVDIFLNSVSLSNSEERKLFLRWLKYEIDDLSREDLGPVYEKYHKITQQLTAAKETEKKQLKKRLKDLDDEVDLRSFGLEHIMREIGQIYEALHLEEPQHLLLKHNLPELAANILLDGYPFELYDGYVNAVPIQWVTDVLKNLDKILKKHKPAARIKVISALGIQSSGKSTMLNALFGCQYAVSAGRCTRGLYCQLIKVEETYSKEIGIDYVLAIDTEGLQAPELSASGTMVKHDNELSTFVIGLGDLTILNLMGENTTCLNDLLPISVHAFLRMEMTTHFRPKCTIVHQNVNKEDQQKLLQQGQILEENLDKMTEMACTVERMEPKSFKDITEFDVSEDVYYLPTLLEGSRPMAPISTRYSEELNVLKQNLLKKATGTQSNLLGSFIDHLQNLWSAIKKDDFVYQFRNTIETEARSKLDEYWCDANWKFRQSIHNILQTGYIQIQNSENVNELDSCVTTLEKKVRDEIINEHKRQKAALSTFINEADKLIKETMMKWSVDMDRRFDGLSTELYTEMSENLKEFKECMRRKFSLKDDKSRYEDTLKKNIDQLVKSVKLKACGNLTEAEILNHFEQNWELWKSKISEGSPKRLISINIENDAFDAISRAFPLGLGVLQKYVQMKSLSSYDLNDFKLETLLPSLQSIKTKLCVIPNTLREDLDNLAKSLFCKVEDKLKSREGFLRPYSQEDIEEVVLIVKDLVLKNNKTIILKLKDGVYLAVIVCGHAIKRLQRIHEEYEKQNSPGNLLEKEKMHYCRIFSALCNEAEIVSILVMECQDILKIGILHKMTQTLPDDIEKDPRDKSFPIKSKTMAIYDHMINMARDGSYDNFKVFIQDPRKSIEHYICKRIDQYAQQKEKPFQVNFEIVINRIRGDVEHALQNSFITGKSDFKTWLEKFRNDTKDLIVFENINRLHELRKGRSFDLDLFFKKVLQCFESIIQDIKSEMCSYLAKNYESIKDEVMKRILKNIIGCTTSCPFCGAICMQAHEGHEGEHYTTLHRPQGCSRRNYRETKELATITCPEALSSTVSFIGIINKKYEWVPYTDYKTVHPQWKITADATGEETSFWNFFFAQYAEEIAGTDLKVPVIPPTWKLLDRKTEIKKLEDKMNK